LEAIKTAAVGTSQTLLQQQRDLCLLHLFNSFLESAPQLVLQLYVTASLGSLLPWTGKLTRILFKSCAKFYHLILNASEHCNA
jgi:XK-related protein